MTIRTREPSVPTHLPPSRLFLDDVQEIVAILKELAETEPGEAGVSVTFSVGNQDCDDIADLRRIMQRNRPVEIQVANDKNYTWMDIRLTGSLWKSSGYAGENAWSAYHKLETIFKDESAAGLPRLYVGTPGRRRPCGVT
jgi:hypothetical protein